jgi:hypothetical protein
MQAVSLLYLQTSYFISGFMIQILNECHEFSYHTIEYFMPFFTTYLCETAFLLYTMTNTKYRNKLAQNMGSAVAIYNSLFVVCFHGCPWQAMDVLQPAGLLYCPLWMFQLWPPDAPAPTDAFRTLAAEVGTYGRGIRTGNFA